MVSRQAWDVSLKENEHKRTLAWHSKTVSLPSKILSDEGSPVTQFSILSK
jgi:hypothetical protein